LFVPRALSDTCLALSAAGLVVWSTAAPLDGPALSRHQACPAKSIRLRQDSDLFDALGWRTLRAAGHFFERHRFIDDSSEADHIGAERRISRGTEAERHAKLDRPAQCSEGESGALVRPQTTVAPALALDRHPKTVWRSDAWKECRPHTFMNQRVKGRAAGHFVALSVPNGLTTIQRLSRLAKPKARPPRAGRIGVLCDAPTLITRQRAFGFGGLSVLPSSPPRQVGARRTIGHYLAHNSGYRSRLRRGRCRRGFRRPDLRPFAVGAQTHAVAWPRGSRQSIRGHQ